MVDSKDFLEFPPPQDGELVLVDAGGRSQRMSSYRNVAVLSGSFNPLHRGHYGLRSAAADLLGASVLFELSVVNADKGRLPAMELTRRLRQFRDPVAITAAPLFQDKARLFPGCWFVIGFDTAVRILAPQYYQNGESGMRQVLASLHQAGHRFLVAARSIDGGTAQTLRDLAVPKGLEYLFRELPVHRFRDDISSTELRRQLQQRRAAERG